ncbi:hypothetical protein AV540_09720 [Brevibacillus parabrevis]|uniref:hypothetical protein n=1 Tax=Brevibacillus parabrevis TaxID=54914 RepID=UPI0007AB2DCC|nr:hypothetical protein [Brevibacillus parabrevis]KZE52882.1 hypothetical protein AV540_09720 [Brevibacillus parabrevis]
MKEEEKKNIHDWFALWTHAAVQVIDVRHFVLQAQESWNSYRLPASSYLYACKGQATVRLDGREYATDRFLLLHGGKGMVLDVKLTGELFVFYLILYKAKMMLPRSADQALMSDGSGEPFHLPYALVPHEPTEPANGQHRSGFGRRARFCNSSMKSCNSSCGTGFNKNESRSPNRSFAIWRRIIPRGFRWRASRSIFATVPDI